MHIAPLLLVSLIVQKDLDQKVTFAEPVMSVQDIVQRIATATNTRLVVSKSEPERRLFLQVKDVPLKDVMAKIAEVTFSDWTSQEGELWLGPSAKKVALARKIITDRKVEQFKKILTETVIGNKEIEPTPENYLEVNQKIRDAWADKKWDKVDELRDLGPTRGFLLRTVAQLDPIPFATSNPGARIVFSTRPTAKQRLLKLSDFPSPVSDLTKQLAEWQYAKQVAWTAQGSERASEIATLQRQRDTQAQSTAPTILIIAENYYGYAWLLKFKLFDRSGRVISNSRATLNTFTLRQPPKFTEVRSAPFQLSEDERSYAKKLIAKLNYSQDTPVPFTDGELERLKRPDLHEPLSYGVSDLLRASAKEDGLNMITAVPDSTYSHVLRLDTSASTVAKAMANIRQWIQWTELTTDSWHVFKFDDPDQWEDDWRPRKASAEAIKAIFESDDPDPVQEYIASLGLKQMENNLVLDHSRALKRVDTSAFNPGKGREVIRFFYSLDKDQRARLLRGEGILTSSLNTKQKIRLDEWTYGCGNGYRNISAQRKRINPMQIPPEGFLELVTKDTQDVWGAMPPLADIGAEPTYRRAQGVPAMAEVRLTIDREPQWEVDYSADSDMYFYTVDEKGLAMEAFQAERPELFGHTGPDKKFYRRAESGDLRISVEFGKLEGVFGSVPGTRKTFGSGVAIDQLPSEVKVMLEKRLVQLRKDYKDAKPTDVSGGGFGPKPKP
ncbi:MAG: hypothetical protein K8R88_08195 [Armatimonadetes bacterium]|nr:hypothetical protein [Armatimonadota bacterium]